MTVVCIAGDPGGARSLSPVVAELARRRIDLQLVGYRQGETILQEHGLPVTRCDEALARQAGELLSSWHADFLLTSTSMNGEDFEKKFIQAARSQHIPCMSVLDFWSNYRGRFTTHPPNGELNALPDQIAVMDASAVEDMTALGFPHERLVITGQPAYDELFQACNPPSMKNQVRSALGVKKDDLLLIYASQPFTEMAAETGMSPVAYDEMECLRLLLDCLGKESDMKVWVRPHPRETAAKFHRLADPRLVITSEFDRISAIHAADGVTGMSSNFLLEAALLARPVLSLQPRQAGGGPLPLGRLQLGEVVTDISAAPAAVASWVSLCRHSGRSQAPRPDSPFQAGAAIQVANLVIDRMNQPKANPANR